MQPYIHALFVVVCAGFGAMLVFCQQLSRFAIVLGGIIVAIPVYVEVLLALDSRMSEDGVIAVFGCGLGAFIAGYILVGWIIRDEWGNRFEPETEE